MAALNKMFQLPLSRVMYVVVLLPLQQGTLTGILLGLSHLDNSEVTLKAISFKQG